MHLEHYFLRGIITYRVSPFELRAYAGAFFPGIPNLFRLAVEEFFYVVPSTFSTCVF